MVENHLRLLSSGITYLLDYVVCLGNAHNPYYFGVNLCMVLLPRDGVSESQFNQVLNNELDQMIKVPI